MASVGIRCGGGRGFLGCRLLKGNQNRENGCIGFCSVNDIGNSRRWKRGRVGAVWREAAVVKEDERKTAGFVYEKIMDEWMRDSVVEIVKNLEETPLLVHVHGSEDDQSRTPRLKTEKAVEEEDWPAVIERWQREEARWPEGVIFVDKLEDDNADGGDNDDDDQLARAWGIVVQGRGVDCSPVCYLLKTSRAGGSAICTHFCLMRVKSFRETARSQLKNCWLLQGQ